MCDDYIAIDVPLMIHLIESYDLLGSTNEHVFGTAAELLGDSVSYRI